MSDKPLKSYAVWDAPTRVFHWINFAAIITLIFFGFVILYLKELSITGGEAKLTLKTVHAWAGYVLITSLAGRFVWGFIGNAFARWRAVLPNRRSLQAIPSDLASFRAGDPIKYVGRGPMGRLSVTLMFLLLLIQASTGLIRAGTDIYYPPVGWLVTSYVAAPGVEPSTLVPGDKSQVDRKRYAQVEKWKIPFGKIHIYTAWTLLVMIGLHIGSVVLKDTRQGGGIISAMFTGRKVLSRPPMDQDEIE